MEERDGSGLGQGSGIDEKRQASGDVSKAEPPIFPDRLDWSMKERGIKDDA